MTASFAAKFALTACALLLGGAAAWGQGQEVPPWTPVWKWSNTFFNCPTADMRPFLTRKAANGDADAQDRMGTFHISTCSGEKNPVEGIRLLERAAQQGNAHALFMLG